jgi:hypothetical protein
MYNNNFKKKILFKLRKKKKKKKEQKEIIYAVNILFVNNYHSASNTVIAKNINTKFVTACRFHLR